MDPHVVAQTAEQVGHDLLEWIGFGTLVGLLAKAIMPGRDPGGAVATLAMGIGGSVIGSGLLMYFSEGRRVTPISPSGFGVALGGAILLLTFYRLFGGRLIPEGELRSPYALSRRRRGAQRVQQVVVRDDL